jgi:hypothetical protein
LRLSLSKKIICYNFNKGIFTSNDENFFTFSHLDFSTFNMLLNELPIGSRLLVRSKKDWRSAAISKIDEEKVTLTVASPSGFSYRLRRGLETEISFDGSLPILEKHQEDWRENFTKYDLRW